MAKNRYVVSTRRRQIVLKDDGWLFSSFIDTKMDGMYHDLEPLQETITGKNGSKSFKPFFILTYKDLPNEPGLFLITIDNEISFIGRSNNLRDCFGDQFKHAYDINVNPEFNKDKKFLDFKYFIFNAIKNVKEVKIFYLLASSLNCESDPNKFMEWHQKFYLEYNQPIWNSCDPISDEGDWTSLCD